MITKEEVQHIAKLARIQLTEKETEKFQKDLGNVLDYFEILKGVDVTDVPPMVHSVTLENVTREDRAKSEEPATIKRLITSVPLTQDNFLKVQSILSEE